jgi:PAS domain S-box-containing protein
MRSATGRALLLFALFFAGATFLAVWGTGTMTRRVVGWQTAIEDVAHRRVIAPGILQRGLLSRVKEVRTLSGALAVMDEAVRAEREQAQATVATSEDRLRAIADHTSAVIFMKDLAGRYLFVNRQFEAVTHLTGATILGKTAHDIFPLEQADAFLSHHQAVIQTGSVLEVEEQVPHDDGVHPFLTILFPLRTESGEIYAVGGISTDHTDRRRAAEETAALQAQNQKLKRSESLGRMAGAIAHSFNNQLGAVIGNLDLALADLTRDAAPIASLTDAMSAARRAADVSALMLTYIGQTIGTRVRIDLAEVCGRHVPILRAVMPTIVALETDAPSPGPVISADRNQVHQVLSSLITNAWEAIGDGHGVVRMTVTTVSQSEISPAHRFPLDWQPQDPTYACLAVADNGCGIADADIEHLFDPFFSSKFVGRGLGLSVVLGIVRSYGGAVTVESEPGRGSVFRVFVPVSAQPIAPQTDGPETAVPHSAPAAGATAAEPDVVRVTAGVRTVLLVEDEPAVRKMAASMLKHLGYAVLEAKDGVEALDVFRQHQDDIRCVLCDLTMPRMSGWQTLAALRALAPAIPVVLASGYDEASVMEGDHPARPDVFLGKPYQLKGLAEAIETALNARAHPHRFGSGQKPDTKPVEC